MGSGFEFKCCNCGNEYYVNLGIGFLYPRVYKETVEKIEDGEYGPDLKETFESVKYAAIDASKVLFKCPDCGNWEVDIDLSIYAPNDVETVKALKFGEKTVQELGGIPYAMSHMLEEDFHLLKEYKHSCKKCGAEMLKFDESKNCSILPCPKCGKENECEPFLICWD